MPVLDWDDEFETGIDYIDYEHRRLVALINQVAETLVNAGPPEAIADCLGELYAQACAHFALEESLMREKKYELFEAHKADHERLLEEFRRMMDAFENGECDTCGVTLDECLRSWFYKHFQTKDARFETLAR